jgi:hypothetical protein
MLPSSIKELTLNNIWFIIMKAVCGHGKTAVMLWVHLLSNFFPKTNAALTIPAAYYGISLGCKESIQPLCYERRN